MTPREIVEQAKLKKAQQDADSGQTAVEQVVAQATPPVVEEPPPPVQKPKAAGGGISLVDNWLPPELRAAGFEIPSGEVKMALDLCTTAPEKKGKTHFAFTGPQPVIAVTTDTGTLEIAEKFRRNGKKVALFNYRVPPESVGKNDMEKEWVKVRRAIDAALKLKRGTIVVDTATEVWELLRLARFGKLTQVMPHHYGPVNAEMRELVKELADNRYLTTVWVHKVKKEYKLKGDKEGWTGNWERAGFGDMPFLCNVVLSHYRVEPEDAPAIFASRVLDTRLEPETLLNLELAGDMNNIPTLGQLAFPDSKESDWV